MYSRAFTQILKQLVDALPNAIGAIFIDWEGEVVDEFSYLNTNDIRLIGAHWAIPFNSLKNIFNRHQLGSPVEVVLRMTKQCIIIRRVTDDYLVVLVLRQASDVPRARYSLKEVEAQLRAQM